MFGALGELPLGGIPDGAVVPAPPSGGGYSDGGGSYCDKDFSRRWKRKEPEEQNDDLAVILAAYVQYYKD